MAVASAAAARDRRLLATWRAWPYQGGTVPNIDVFAPVDTGYSVLPLATPPNTTLTQTGVYLQDQTTGVALNATNLTDKVYVSSCLSRGDCWWGARRSVSMTATYRY